MTFNERLEMCKNVEEGCELGELFTSLHGSVRAALSASDDFTAELLLVILENIIRTYVRDILLSRYCDWEEYKYGATPEAFTYFSGGAKKMTEEEFEYYKKSV